MNPVERLQAAIEKLERLRDESDPIRPDSAWVTDYDVTEDARRILVLDSHNGGYDGSTVAEVTSEGRAQLIVTLHRTIDAQLAILWAAQIETTDVMTAIEKPYWEAALALADAILGASS